MRIIIPTLALLAVAAPAAAQSFHSDTFHRDTKVALTDALDRICAPVILGTDPALLLVDAKTRGWKPVAGADPVQVERSTPDGRITVEWPSFFRNCKISVYRTTLIDDLKGFLVADDWAKRQPDMTMAETIEKSGSSNIYKWSSPKLRVELRSQYKPSSFPNVPQDYLLVRPAG